MTPSVLVLGESPPPKAPPDFVPFDCASGDNLARFLGLRSRAEVLAHLPRANCFDVPTGVTPDAPKWDPAQARVNASAVIERNFPTEPGRRPAVVVALGRRPADALGMHPDAPAMSWQRLPHLSHVDAIHVPHPSARSTALNSDFKRREARQAMLVEVALGCPTLRPWHFRLDEPEVLADLGAALCPIRPALGVAACVMLAEIKAHHDRVSAPEFLAVGGKRAVNLAESAGKALVAVSVSLRHVAIHARSGNTVHLASGLSLSSKEVAARERTAGRMVELSLYPSAVLRAIYGRHVALGVAP